MFALVDLDIQLHKINNYYLSDTEQIFYHLYKEAQVIAEQASKSHIWVTGLIHKEAYFISPDIQELFDCSLLSPQFSDRPVKLRDIYPVICQEIPDDIDLKNNFNRVTKRINYCKNIDCSEIEKFKYTWNSEFKNNIDSEEVTKLILALLTIRKAKKYWHQIIPSNDWTRTHEIFREQLSLEIGRFYASQNCDVNNHIPYFFKTLYQFA